MIIKYKIGIPIETDAVVVPCEQAEKFPEYLNISLENGFSLETKLDEDAVVYGLGENVRGINKRGWIYESRCSDEKDHEETTRALYCAHNFLVVDGMKTFGLFVDNPGIVAFDIGYSRMDLMRITAEQNDLYLYVIEEETVPEIVKEFRRLIGKSYAAPKWAFGYQQSRWGYGSEEDVREVFRKYRELQLPLDAIGMDIDYMERYKDFRWIVDVSLTLRDFPKS